MRGCALGPTAGHRRTPQPRRARSRIPESGRETRPYEHKRAGNQPDAAALQTGLSVAVPVGERGGLDRHQPRPVFKVGFPSFFCFPQGLLRRFEAPSSACSNRVSPLICSRKSVHHLLRRRDDDLPDGLQEHVPGTAGRSTARSTPAAAPCARTSSAPG